jgi:hypothetical protein
MAIHLVPTLALMEGVYRLPADGGPRSERFSTYMRLVREREGGGGLGAYDPMAGPEALATVTALLALDAEALARAAAQELAARCEAPASFALAVAVAAPGPWAQRRLGEAEDRLRPDREEPAIAALRAGEPAEEADVRRAATAEAARVLWNQLHGAPGNLAGALRREGLALALAGVEPWALDAAEHEAVTAALEQRGASDKATDVLGVAYGDPLAAITGWPALGLADRAGCRWARDRAAERIAALGPAAALREPVT